MWQLAAFIFLFLWHEVDEYRVLVPWLHANEKRLPAGFTLSYRQFRAIALEQFALLVLVGLLAPPVWIEAMIVAYGVHLLVHCAQMIYTRTKGLFLPLYSAPLQLPLVAGLVWFMHAGAFTDLVVHTIVMVVVIFGNLALLVQLTRHLKQIGPLLPKQQVFNAIALAGVIYLVGIGFTAPFRTEMPTDYWHMLSLIWIVVFAALVVAYLIDDLLYAALINATAFTLGYFFLFIIPPITALSFAWLRSNLPMFLLIGFLGSWVITFVCATLIRPLLVGTGIAKRGAEPSLRLSVVLGSCYAMILGMVISVTFFPATMGGFATMLSILGTLVLSSWIVSNLKTSIWVQALFNVLGYLLFYAVFIALLNSVMVFVEFFVIFTIYFVFLGAVALYLGTALCLAALKSQSVTR